ncbi:hypothetical protein OH77DRAFT_400823 [Trametes cingulata]|nr:hypothetical protein OH77DRAFT_400823 [Trametes cingulata]
MDPPEPTELPVQDDQVSDSSATVTATASKSTSPTSPTLPPGWDKGKVEDDMTGIILGLSLSLAVALIVFMMGIVRWRQKRHKRRDKDAEHTSSVLDGRSGEESEDHKRARAQQRLWAKASAKWVANVRQSARRRRKRMATTTPKDSDGRILREAQASTSAISLARTHTAHDIDRRSSRASSLRSPSRQTRSRSPSPTSSDRHRGSLSGGGEEPSSSPHPPAYLQSSGSNSASAAFQHQPQHHHVYSRWRSHPLDIAPDSLSHHHASGVPPPPPPLLPLDPESDSPPPCSADRSPPPPLSPLPYEPPVHSAHVAVDDKAVLARLAHLASAPPPHSHSSHLADGHDSAGAEGGGGSSEMRPSVPVLDDDPFEGPALGIEFDVDGSLPSDRRPGLGRGLASQAHDASPAPPHGSPPRQRGLAPRLSSVSMRAMVEDEDDPEDGEVPSYAEDVRQHGPLLVLPPPPAKVPLTGPLFYEYPDEFERDVETVDPPEEPSAPPFGEPSSPHLLAHSQMIAPSAPPLEYEDEALPGSEGLLPSAPPLDYEDTGSTSGSPIPSSAPAASHSESVPEPPGGSGGVGRSAPLSASPDDQGNARARGSASTNGAAADAHAEEDGEEGEAEPAPPQYLP